MFFKNAPWAACTGIYRGVVLKDGGGWTEKWGPREKGCLVAMGVPSRPDLGTLLVSGKALELVSEEPEKK